MTQQRWTRAVNGMCALACAVGLMGWQTSTALGVYQESGAGMLAANQVTETDYRELLGDDRGAMGILYTHAGDNRGFGAQHDLARANIKDALESYGLSVELHPFTYSGGTYYNVVGTMIGTVYPDKEYIIGAHYDSVNNPGADDNASGTALMIQAASIISQYPSDYTIRFIAFDREEQGLVGSYAYVNSRPGMDVLGMISTDMVAYNNGTNSADIFGGPGSVGLRGKIAAAVIEYGQGLGANLKGSSGGSDHRPFEQAGYEACLFIEDWGNPNYHSSRDNVDVPNYIDYAYATRMGRSIVGYLVDAAGVQVSVCYPDCDDSTGSGVLDIFDFLCFQNSFVTGQSYACDCDTSTGVGICDILDFLCFQDSFVAGCP